MKVIELYRIESEHLGEVWFQDPGLRDQWLADNATTAGKCVCFKQVVSESLHEIYGYKNHPFPDKRSKRIPHLPTTETRTMHNLNMGGKT